MKRKIIKYSFLSVGAVLFAYALLKAFTEAASYSNGSVTDTLVNLFIELMLEFGIVEVIAILFILIGITVKTENVRPDKLPKDKTKKAVWKIIFALGLLPFVYAVGSGIYSVFFGFTFFMSTYYGIEAFVNCVGIWSVLLWPLYIIGAALIIASIIKIKQLNKNRSEL